MEVEFRHVTFSRGARTILRDVSFSTGDTPIFLLFGESGSGKTSLLRLVNRLDEPGSGEVRVGGRPVTGYPPRELRRRVGMIFQEPRLLDGTVGENVLFAARYHGIAVDVEGVLEKVGLPGMEGRMAGSLSGGEQQRAAIARALAVRPSLLLMDEPTSSLDEAAAAGIEDLLCGLVDSGELRIVFVTHDRSQLRRLGGRGVVIRDGVIAREGPVDVLGEARNV